MIEQLKCTNCKRSKCYIKIYKNEVGSKSDFLIPIMARDCLGFKEYRHKDGLYIVISMFLLIISVSMILHYNFY